MFRHYIFTRFNKLDSSMSIYNNPQIENPEEWMEHRIGLFNNITLPSVMLQTEVNFTWLLSFDQRTPQKIIDFYASFPRVKIIYEYPATYLRGLYGNSLKDGDWIITTRLDNDDYIAPTFIEKVQSKFNEEFLLVDTDGRQWDLKTNKLYARFIEHPVDPKKEIDLKTGKLYTVERKTCNSPFLSLIEQVGTPWESTFKDPVEREVANKNLAKHKIQTVYFCSHGKMEWHFPAVKINEVLYRMVIHDRNAANRIIGNEVGRL